MNEADETKTDEPLKPETSGESVPATEVSETPKPAAELPAKTNRLKRWWAWTKAHPVRLYGSLAGAVLLVAVLVISLTPLKYPVVGLVWKSTVSLKVVDATSGDPVPHATVALAGQANFTDKTGAVRFTKVKPGPTTVKVSRLAYATHSQTRTIGFGQQALGTVKLTATGIKVTVMVTNKLSGKPEADVEAKSGEVQGVSDEHGQMILVFPPDANNTNQPVTYTKDGFNALDATAAVKASGAVVVAVVPAGKAYYLSNRSGRIDLYASDLDGLNAEVAVAGTGNESPDTGVLPNSYNSRYLALVSSREGKRVNGQLTSALFMFDTTTRKLTKVEDNYSFFTYRTWVNDTLVYEKFPAAGDPSGRCPDLKGFDPKSGSNSLLVAGSPNACPSLLEPYDGGFLYSVASDQSAQNGTFYATLGGKAAKKVSDTPSQTVVQRAKDTLLSEYYTYSPTYSTTWQSIDLEHLTATKVANGPSNSASRTYNDSPGDKHSAFIEERDGKTELYLTDPEGGNEQKLTNLGAVNQFVSWIGDDYIVFSVTKSDENALYAVAVDGGQASKIADFYRANSRTYGGGANPAY